ncbi:MAG: TolC family protein [Gloeotrichia echinulata DVL01]|nr:TolC family protein [Gloeotrichia echinulata DEX184]
MNGQQLFHSFLPGVTAAVLTTQPAWAGTIKVNGVQLASSGSVLTSTYGSPLVADMMNPQPTQTVGNNFPDLVATPSWTSLNVKPGSSYSITVIQTRNTSHTGLITPRKDQNRFLSLTPSSNSSQQVDQNPGAQNNSKPTNLGTWGQKSQPIFVPTFSSTPDSVHKETLETLPPSSSLPTVLQPVGTGTGSTSLLDMSSCKTTPSAALLVSSKACLQKIAPRERVAQSNTSTTPPSGNFAPAGVVSTPTTPAKVNQAPGGNVPTPTTPAKVNPAPGGNVPTPTTPANVTPAPADADQIFDKLKPNPNPLQFPTKPEEVKLEGNQPITLAQALEIAKRNNRDLQVSLLELQRNQAALKEAQAALFPTVGLQADLTRQRDTGQTLGAKQNEQEQQQAQAGLPPELRTPIIRRNAPEITSFSSTAQLTYNLYTSGSRLAAIGVAEEQVRSSELAVESRSEEIRLNVSTEYYDLQQADEQVRIAQSAVKNAAASLRDAEALERAGVGTRFDVLRSQVNLANATQDLTNAISQQQVARRRLATRLSVPQSVNITTADPVKLAGLWNQSLEQSIVLAFQNRPELQQQLAQRNISEQRRREALAALGPQVSLIASYSLLDQFNDSVSIADGYSVGVRATLNLFDGGAAKARAAQQKANIAIAETNFAEQRNQIRFQVEQAFSSQQSNLENVNTASTALEQAREALRLARLRFQAGVGTQTDVINSENDLTRAEGNRIRAILDYNRALANLQRAVTIRAFR